MVSKKKLLKCIMEHTRFTPTIKIDGSTVYIFWLIDNRPNSDSLNSIENSLKELEEIKEITAEHKPKCELAAFIIHLKTDSVPDFAPDP